MRIVFMGTPDFAAVSLQRLLDERFDVVGIFTQPDKPKNRGMKLQPSPVKEIALAAGLPVFQPAKMRDGTALADLQSLRPDILVVVAYGRILPDGCHSIHLFIIQAHFLPAVKSLSHRIPVHLRGLLSDNAGLKD